MLQVELDYKLLLTDLIRKQISVLGSDITFFRVKKIAGLVLSESGEIVSFNRDPQLIVQDFIETFVELYGRPAERALEPILIHYGYAFGQTNPNLYNSINTATAQNGQAVTPEKKGDEGRANHDTSASPMEELNKIIRDINKNLTQHKNP